MGEHGYRPVPMCQIYKGDYVRSRWGRQQVTRVVTNEETGDITLHLANGKKMPGKAGTQVELMRT
jgi:hypothetical protein